MDAGKTSHYTSPFQVADILLGVKPWWNFPEVGGCSIHLPDMPPVGWVPFVLEGLGSDVYPRARGQRGSLFGDGERPQRVGWMVECLFRQGVGTISKTWLGYWKMGNRMVCLSFQACFFFCGCLRGYIHHKTLKQGWMDPEVTCLPLFSWEQEKPEKKNIVTHVTRHHFSRKTLKCNHVIPRAGSKKERHKAFQISLWLKIVGVLFTFYLPIFPS